MSRRQFLEWEAFYQLDPWDGERDDLLAGIICSTIASCSSALSGNDWPPSKFMPDWLGTENRSSLPTKEEHEAKVDKVFATLRLMSNQKNGSDNSKHGDSDKRPHEAA